MLKGCIFYQQYYIYFTATDVHVFVFKNEFEPFCFVVTFCYIAADKSFKLIVYDCMDCNNRGSFSCVSCWGRV